MKVLLNKTSIAAICWIISWIFFKTVGEYMGFGINKTNSQIPGIYAYFPIKFPLKRGDLVDFYLDFSDLSLEWIKYRKYIDKNERLLKNIGAIAGDFLYTFYPNIYLCNEKYFTKNCIILGRCKSKDNNGSPLFCQSWNGMRIPENYFYLKSDRVSNSFDSRYFGLVNVKNIQHKLKIVLEF